MHLIIELLNYVLGTVLFELLLVASLCYSQTQYYL